MKISLSSTDVLYHLTTLYPAVSIVQSNRFDLKPSEGTDAEASISKGAYYLSTTRSKTGAYSVRGVYSASVLFVLDGRKLGHRYKIVPVDYWETNKLGLGQRSTNYESEDRVLSSKSSIPAFPYIKAIHAHVNFDKQDKMFALKKAALLHKIPIWFYKEAKSLLLMDTRKAVPVRFSKVLPVVQKPRAYDFKYRIRTNSLLPWLKLWMHPIDASKEWHSDEAKALGDRVYDAYNRLRYGDDAMNALKADLHNEKVTPYGDISRGREHLDKIVTIMRNLKLSPKEFVARLRDKWFPEPR